MSEKDEYLEFMSDYEKEDRVLTQIMAIAIHSERQIDRLIRDHCQRPSKVLKWSFSVKTEFLFSLGILPEWLNHNLIVMNKIRNHFAHKPNAEFKKISDLVIRTDQGHSIDISKEHEDSILTRLFVWVYASLSSIEY